MVKLNLVTVVGDFHKSLTLVQMIKHYYKLVDAIYINYYVTEVTAEQSIGQSEQLISFLRENGVYFPNVNVMTYIGQKYDWDQVTELYNNTTSLDKKAYWIIADCDEFQIWPVPPREIAMNCKKRGYTFVTGGFLDRIGEEGRFSEILSPEDDLDALFPLVGFFRYPMSGACPNKVVMVKGGQKVCSGQHYAIFPDGSNSWGTKHLLRYPVDECFVQVHHFKWDRSVLHRLLDVSKSKCKYSEEYATMRKNIKNCKIDIKDKAYNIERYDALLGYDSYRHWNKVKNNIINV